LLIAQHLRIDASRILVTIYREADTPPPSEAVYFTPTPERRISSFHWPTEYFINIDAHASVRSIVGYYAALSRCAAAGHCNTE